MDENTNAVETVEVEEQEAIDAAFDEDWGETTPEDDDLDLVDETEADPDGQPEEAEAAGDTGSGEESSDEPAVEQEDEPAETEEKEEQNQLFKIKVNGEEREVTLDEITELAQKGSDYDRVKQERDSFKQDAPTIQKYKTYEAFLQELADSSGMDIDALMDGTRARLLMSAAENEGKTLTEDEAMAKAKAMRQPKEEKPAEPEPEDPEEANRRMLLNFIAIYPDVDAKSIPEQVWKESAITGDLVGAYQRHENRLLKEEIATLKQNQKNKERSTGSRRSAGATAPKDPFDEGWEDSL